MNKLEIELDEIFKKYNEMRICVLGTTCCGKTTLQKKLPTSIDMDEALWPTLTKAEEEYICSKPWTNDIGKFTSKLVNERVIIKPGHPLFSLILLECDIIVYLDICDELLREHCNKRNVSYEDAVNVKIAIENSINKKRDSKNILVINLQILE